MIGVIMYEDLIESLLVNGSVYEYVSLENVEIIGGSKVQNISSYVYNEQENILIIKTVGKLNHSSIPKMDSNLLIERLEEDVLGKETVKIYVVPTGLNYRGKALMPEPYVPFGFKKDKKDKLMMQLSIGSILGGKRTVEYIQDMVTSVNRTLTERDDERYFRVMHEEDGVVETIKTCEKFKYEDSLTFRLTSSDMKATDFLIGFNLKNNEEEVYEDLFKCVIGVSNPDDLNDFEMAIKQFVISIQAFRETEKYRLLKRVMFNSESQSLRFAFEGADFTEVFTIDQLNNEVKLLNKEQIDKLNILASSQGIEYMAFGLSVTIANELKLHNLLK